VREREAVRTSLLAHISAVLDVRLSLSFFLFLSVVHVFVCFARLTCDQTSKARTARLESPVKDSLQSLPPSPVPDVERTFASDVPSLSFSLFPRPCRCASLTLGAAGAAGPTRGAGGEVAGERAAGASGRRGSGARAGRAAAGHACREAAAARGRQEGRRAGEGTPLLCCIPSSHIYLCAQNWKEAARLAEEVKAAAAQHADLEARLVLLATQVPPFPSPAASLSARLLTRADTADAEGAGRSPPRARHPDGTSPPQLCPCSGPCASPDRAQTALQEVEKAAHEALLEAILSRLADLRTALSASDGTSNSSFPLLLPSRRSD
jgi:hypothetical protein